MFALAYMGRKRCFRMLLLHSTTVLSGAVVFARTAKAFEGATPPRFRPTYADANPDFLLRGSGTQPRVRLSSRKAACSSATPPTSTGNSGERGAPVQTFNAPCENRLLLAQTPLLP
jgi:hypothetical protein